MSQPNKVLVGVTFSGDSKNYVKEKFLEMANHCIRPLGIDIAWSTNRYGAPYNDIYLPMDHPGDNSEDVLMIAREDQRRYALENGYDKLIWQGVDCLFESPEDVRKLLSYDVPAIGALTCGRTNSNHPVAAQFVRDLDGWTEEHTVYSDWVLERGWVIEAGIPGADACVLDRSALDLSWVGKHIPWYDRERNGTPNISCEGWYWLEMLKRGQMVYLDTSIKTWHCSEDGVARMYKGIERPTNELSW